MSDLACTFDEFKLRCKEFRDAAPSLNRDELDNAWKCLALSYLNMSEPMWQNSAAIALKLSAPIKVKREIQLESATKEQPSTQQGEG